MSGGTEDAVPARPVLRVLRGAPTADQLAAVVAVLMARGSSPPAPEPAVPLAWAARAAGLRRPLAPGPGGWRASGRPGAW